MIPWFYTDKGERIRDLRGICLTFCGTDISGVRTYSTSGCVHQWEVATGSNYDLPILYTQTTSNTIRLYVPRDTLLNGMDYVELTSDALSSKTVVCVPEGIPFR